MSAAYHQPISLQTVSSDLIFTGTAARSIEVTQSTDSAGWGLAISAGATVTAADSDGGTLSVAPGRSTGQGKALVAIKSYDITATSDSTTANNAQDRTWFASRMSLSPTSGTSTTVLTFTLDGASKQSVAYNIQWSVFTKKNDNSAAAVFTNTTTGSAIMDAGSLLSSNTEPTGTVITTSGSLTVVSSASSPASNKLAWSITPTFTTAVDYAYIEFNATFFGNVSVVQGAP